jgi:hypothetical protein
MNLFQFLAAILSFGAPHTKPSWRFVESPRRIDSCLRDTFMLLKNILGAAELVVNHSRRFYDSPKSIDTLCSVSQRTANPEKRKIREPRTQLSILLGDS